MIRAYHFVGKTLRDGRPIPADGEWLKENGELRICHKGLHASLHVADAVQFAPGNTLCLVELDGEVQSQSDKVCAQRRRIIARIDATQLLRADARASALSVAHLWDMPAIVKQYLETGDESIRAAARAAAAATYAATATAAAAAAATYAATATAAAAAAAYAATYAARAAATAAAAAATYAATAAAYAATAATARERLQKAVDAAFKEIGV